MIELGSQQKLAIDNIKDWFHNKNDDFRYLAGYAGTGKTTVIKYLLEELDLDPSQVKLACPTGKASLQLDNKVDVEYKVRTIHKLMYIPIFDKDKTKPVRFRKIPKYELRNNELIIIDEASMVDAETKEALLSFGVKILFVGDEGQLPAFRKNKTGISVLGKPDDILTDIQRQDEDNMIIQLSKAIRYGKKLPFGRFGKNGEVEIISKKDFMSNKRFVPYFKQADHIICGTNKTRKDINQTVRRLHGFDSVLPQVGDKLICTKNDWTIEIGDTPLVNGLIGTVDKVHDIYEGYDDFAFDFKIPTGDVGNDFLTHKSMFDPRVPEIDYDKSLTYFDYGYATTCHKAQGSEWDNVLVFADWFDKDSYIKWLYTATTRAVKNVVLVI